MKTITTNAQLHLFYSQNQSHVPKQKFGLQTDGGGQETSS